MLSIPVNETIQLKILEMNDAETIYNLIDTDRVHLREWLPWVDCNTDVEDVEKFISSGLEQQLNNRGFHTGIWYCNTLVGVIGFHPLNHQSRNTSIGYWINSKYEGKGIMTHACRQLVDYAMNELGMHRVEIRCAVENYRSRAIPAKLGFKEEGIIRDAEWLGDHFIDLVVYGILSTEWFNDSN